ncbi:inositol polyphosphate kinase [Cardiosporidium cionae]|uniref:Kinase n=1 Tax=Cardiosporidium cionae TaxID=476202 RepID=A0ABQ7J8A5_9APIC|nr:inositol polyphosphate kinase [Cardiosporidium cionae]|eukprot:KAF8820216.1 inositol polyphosphate kinase [Cardiosporidium cionae]
MSLLTAADSLFFYRKWDSKGMNSVATPSCSAPALFQHAENSDWINHEGQPLQLPLLAGSLAVNTYHPTVTANSVDSEFLLAAGHRNKFCLYPDENWHPTFVLKVTSLREVQCYEALHNLANDPLVSWNSLIPLIGKDAFKENIDEADFCQILQKIISFNKEAKFSPVIRLGDENHDGLKKKKLSLQPKLDGALRKTRPNDSPLFYECTAKSLLKRVPVCCETYLYHQKSTNKSSKGFGIIKMVNLTCKMKRPLVLDIKMGRRLYGDEASEEKKERAIKKAMARSITTLGFSFSGMVGNTFHGEHLLVCGGSRSTGIRVDENPLTVAQYAQHVFIKFLSALRNCEISLKVGTVLINEIQEIMKLFEEQTLLAFYGSSLLFVVDTSIQDCKEITNETVHVKMIDFANVTLFPNKRDEDYLFGLKNLLNALKIAVKNFVSSECSDVTKNMQ